jgi:hypothetical protein
MVPVDERPDGLDGDIGREDEVARGDELLRPTLRRLGHQPRTREQPDDHETGERLNQAVEAKPDERDRPGRDPGRRVRCYSMPIAPRDYRATISSRL